MFFLTDVFIELKKKNMQAANNAHPVNIPAGIHQNVFLFRAEFIG
jgi:hypothetical protein